MSPAAAKQSQFESADFGIHHVSLTHYTVSGLIDHREVRSHSNSFHVSFAGTQEFDALAHPKPQLLPHRKGGALWST